MAFNHLQNTSSQKDKEKFIEALANDENLLNNLEEIFNQVCKRLSMKWGESGMWENQGGLWNMQTQDQ